ncbi:hypothetical protein BJ878DRAFT_538206 [Calycina marina]|uniref:EKC/KEOPS complex subunit GON7 n=1 Tax=Calycina marina TaxID=1763456 RepID=A0A9P8CIP5_9HELO|nr:hypothetical protein BJ878DRAFT_538206 [Calycina marina]
MSSSTEQLTATYTSPANAPFTHTSTVTSLLTSGAADKAAYLRSLREAEDKAVEAEKGRVADEKNEEDNYGEEVVEE